MYKKFNLDKINNNYLILLFTFLAFFNQLNYFRIKINETIIFLPRILMVLFLMIFIVKIFSILNNNKHFFQKKNLLYFFIFYAQAFLSLIYLNNDFLKEGINYNFIFYFSYDFFKYFLIYIFFCIIGVNLLNNKNIKIFFKFYLSLSYIVIFIGYFFFIFYIINSYEFTERVFYYDDPSIVGYRFYSLLGEPRDASVFLITNCCIIALLFKNQTIDQQKKFYPYIFIIIFLSFFALLLTKSFSGVIGILLGFIIFLFIFTLDLIKKRVELRNIFLKIVLLSILILIFLIPLFLSDRISDYFSQIYILIKNSSTEIETLRIGSQTKDLMPLLKFAGYIINLEIKYIIFGNGSLSSYYFGAHEFAHPHSFLTRIFFDNGILGFMIYSLFIFSALNKNSNLLEKFTLSFAYGSFLSVHSSFLFVFLMILMYFKKTNFNKN